MFKIIFNTFKSKNILENCAQSYGKYNRHVSQFKRSPNLKLGERNLNVVNEILSTNPVDVRINFGQWKEIRTQILQTDRTINKVNVDAMIMGQLELDRAKSYVKFLEHENLEINLATHGRILRLYYNEFEKSNKKLSDEDYQAVKTIIQDMTAAGDGAYAATTAENIILALCMTDAWKESLKYLQITRLSCRPSTAAYSAIAVAAFDHNDVEAGWQMIEEVVTDEKFPKCTVFFAWIDLCLRDRSTCLENIARMLHFVESNNIMLSDQTVQRLEVAFQTFNYKTSYSSITPNYECTSCKRKLSELVISDEDFYRIRDSFLQKVLIRKDVFLKSSPAEIDRFLSFLDKNVLPYDIIIDGLNVAYSAGNQKPTIVYANLLSSVVEYFIKKDKNVLVLGRKHMNNWPKHQMTFIRQNATLFLTENLSQDDPFLLYAALKNGPNTCFMSRDLMRSHSYLMGKDLKLIFKQWQQGRQYGLIYAGANGKLKLKAPAKYKMSVQRCGDNWHIPFSSESNANPVSTFEMPDSWLCAVAN